MHAVVAKSFGASSGPGRRRARQQLLSFPASAVVAGGTPGTIFFNSLRLTGHHAEQIVEILHKATPDLCRDPKTIEQRSKRFQHRTSLVGSSLPSCPVQQAHIICRRHRRKPLVATPVPLFDRTRTDRTHTSLKFHRSQLTSSFVAAYTVHPAGNPAAFPCATRRIVDSSSVVGLGHSVGCPR